MFGTKILESTLSKYNKEIVVWRSWGLGNYIKVNGLTQSGGIVESIWKYTLKRVKAEKKESIKNVLILGLGGGTVASLVLKYWPQASITGVEIDKKMVDLGVRYLGLDTDKIRVEICDAYKFITSSKSHQIYDLVIVDLYTGDEYPKEFETDKFLKKLTKHKFVLINRLYYKEKIKLSDDFKTKLEKIFAKITIIKPEANIMFFCE